jgi:HSP20 family protein
MNTRLVSRPVPTRRLTPATLLGDFDRLFGTRPVARRNEKATVVPRIDVRETDEAWLIDAELPGLDQSDIDVSVDEGVLTISGERKSEEVSEDEETGFRHLERYHGSFQRSLRIPEDVDADAIKAAYKNGVLSLTVPKPPNVEPELLHIPVTVE